MKVNGSKVCATDLARQSATWPEKSFRYRSTLFTGRMLDKKTSLSVSVGPDGSVCVDVPKVATSDSAAPNAAERYAIVDIGNGIAEGPLRMHFYDLGGRGLKLVGIQRPDSDRPSW